METTLGSTYIGRIGTVVAYEAEYPEYRRIEYDQQGMRPNINREAVFVC